MWVPGGAYGPNTAGGDPDALLGFPIQVDNAMPVMAANAKSVFSRDFRAGYIVRRVAGVQMMRLAQRYADVLQLGLFGYLRLDARPDDAAVVRAYANSTT